MTIAATGAASAIAPQGRALSVAALPDSATASRDALGGSATDEFFFEDPIPHIRVRPFINPWGAALFGLLLVLGLLAIYVAGHVSSF